MESSLSLQLSDFAAEVGYRLGYGRLASAWTGWVVATPYVPDASLAGSNLADIMSVLASAQRAVYFPKSLDGSPMSHRWTWLTPERVLATAANVGVYDLPDDFRCIVGELTYRSTDATFLTLKKHGIDQLNRMLQFSLGQTGKPSAYAVFPKQSDQTYGQRWQVSLCLIPDAAYSLSYRADITPQAMSAFRPYPYGGAPMAELMLLSCLAESEFKVDGEMGVAHAKFQETLQAAISEDLRSRAPDYRSYAGDGSSQPLWGEYAPWLPMGTITTGVLYEGQVP